MPFVPLSLYVLISLSLHKMRAPMLSVAIQSLAFWLKKKNNISSQTYAHAASPASAMILSKENIRSNTNDLLHSFTLASFLLFYCKNRNPQRFYFFNFRTIIINKMNENSMNKWKRKMKKFETKRVFMFAH